MRALVVIADIVRSRRLEGSARRHVQADVERLLEADGRFRVSGGDEFEWVLPDHRASLRRLFDLRVHLATPTPDRPGVLLRCGIGRGELTVHQPQDPYASDGPAFHAARLALERLKLTERRHHLVVDRQDVEGFPQGMPRQLTAWEDDAPRPVAVLRDALWIQLDGAWSRWTEPQLAALQQLTRGADLTEAARILEVTPQAVSQRLAAANVEAAFCGYTAIADATWGGT